jgi:hypothetical protein
MLWAGLLLQNCKTAKRAVFCVLGLSIFGNNNVNIPVTGHQIFKKSFEPNSLASGCWWSC